MPSSLIWGVVWGADTTSTCIGSTAVTPRSMEPLSNSGGEDFSGIYNTPSSSGGLLAPCAVVIMRLLQSCSMYYTWYSLGRESNVVFAVYSIISI